MVYRGIQGYTRVNRGTQGYTGVYKGTQRQRFTEEYRGYIQGYTRVNRGVIQRAYRGYRGI